MLGEWSLPVTQVGLEKLVCGYIQGLIPQYGSWAADAPADQRGLGFSGDVFS